MTFNQLVDDLYFACTVELLYCMSCETRTAGAMRRRQKRRRGSRAGSPIEYLYRYCKAYSTSKVTVYPYLYCRTLYINLKALLAIRVYCICTVLVPHLQLTMTQSPVHVRVPVQYSVRPGIISRTEYPRLIALKDCALRAKASCLQCMGHHESLI